MPDTSADKPGIRLIPPLIYLAALAVAFAVDWLWPVAVLPAGVQYALGAILMLAGTAMALWAVGLFRRADTPFDVRRPATALVVDGPFRISRNPGYVGLIAFSIGIGIAADNAWVLATVAIATVLLHRFVIVLEERHLEVRFGDAYRAYRARVRRWL